MAEYIKRETLKEHLYGGKFQEGCAGCDEPGEGCIECIMDEIDNFPAADVAPVRRGKWEETDWVEPDGHGFGVVKTLNAGLRCSWCTNVFKKELLWKRNYCPNCGAKMEVQNG